MIFFYLVLDRLGLLNLLGFRGLVGRFILVVSLDFVGYFFLFLGSFRVGRFLDNLVKELGICVLNVLNVEYIFNII